ncbi:DHA2 family efflux MFS transporter permease subunit [Lactiplantibacillus modestisalitolerans]|uniref:DHA2 family efflux MFS transporter permease subunit n=1 Tax=Lactiplantibacillus modestisalitolerans TaxID=1457219 RepID=A0ABV5WTA2_9LACO|nr:DHA2 family efflux MFS transporter permease subunit [Lactiplantibacillus modestisalitolerans]
MTKKVDLKLILAVVATGLLSFCGVIVETAMNITFPVLMRQFQLNAATVQWMTTAYLLVVAIIVPISAFLKRRFRTKTLFITANLLFILGLIIDSSALNFPLLVVGRIVQGLGTGIALPLMFNIILDWVPLDQRGTLMGIGTLITAIAPALGPTYGGLVISALNWHWVFILLLPLLVLSLILGIYAIRQAEPPIKTTFDVRAWVMVMLIFIGFTFAFSRLQQLFRAPVVIIGWLVVGVVGLVAFVWLTGRSQHPLISLKIFQTQSFNWHLTGFFLVQVNALGLAFILPNYLQLVDGKSALAAGLYILPGAAIGAILAPLGGRLLDKFGAAKPILTGAVILVVAIGLFTLLGMRLTGPLVMGIYILLMIGMGITMGNTMTSGLSQLSAERQADGNAVFNTLQQFAGATGTSLVSAVITLIQERTSGSAAHAVATGSTVALILLFILIACNLVALFLAMRTRQSAHALH